MSAPIPPPTPPPPAASETPPAGALAAAAGTVAPAAGAPAKKPPGLVRWGVLIFLVVAFLAFAFVGAGPATKWAVETYGTRSLGADVVLESASFNVFTLSVTLRGLRVKDPVDASKNQFEAQEVRGTLDPLGCLRGQLVIAEAAVVKPRGRLVRNADGTIGTEPPPEPPPGTAPGEVPVWRKKLEEEAKKRDLVDDVKKLFEKLKRKRDEAVAKREAEEKRRREQGVTDRMARADYVRPRRPLVVVRRVLADGVEIVIEDRASGAPPQTITDATVEVKEWSSAPTRHEKPMEVRLDGKLAGAPESAVKLAGLLDLTGDETISQIDAHLANLPLSTLDPYLKRVPVIFEGGSLATVDLPLAWRGFEIDWKPAVLLDRIEAKAREPGSKIAGFESERVARELTNAGKLLLDSIRIHGPVYAPSIEGDVETVKRLVLEGGKAYALKQGQKVLDEQKAKLLEKNPALQKKLEESGAGKLVEEGASGLGGALRGLTGGSASSGASPGASAGGSAGGSTGASPEKSAGDAAKEAADKALDFFGGKKK
jgi:hypothetical protein